MAANAPNAQACGLRLLRYNGIQSLVAQPASSLTESVSDADLQDVAVALTGALQEMHDYLPLENKERTFSFPLRAPVTGSCAATKYSTTISSFLPTFQSYMKGCTIRLAGDSQDNEIASATELAAPYMGTSGTVTTTIYSDAYQLDDSVDGVVSLMLPNEYPLVACQDREEFMAYVGTPLVSTDHHNAIGFPFFRFYQKTVSRPRAWMIEGFYDPTLTYEPRRIRVAPMPDQDYSVMGKVSRTPPRVLSTDISPGSSLVMPVPNGWVESVLIPIALKKYTGTPTFKNASVLPEIERGYQRAVATLKNTYARKADGECATYI